MIGKLIEGIKKTGAPIVVGLDPDLKFVPPFIMENSINEYGETLEAAADAVLKFNIG
ncbi:MAG: orotidine 5'-phosphate decarboxylase, partial [Lachnospiraceae bacterium]|nr:orotidine 5'-phosphate decarboxylase [Lachnospiraceae bacterium]